jgi:hypothetical protein
MGISSSVSPSQLPTTLQLESLMRDRIIENLLDALKSLESAIELTEKVSMMIGEEVKVDIEKSLEQLDLVSQVRNCV